METVADRQKGKAPATSRIPLELWIRVAHCLIEDVDDEAAIIHAWLDARRVCKLLRGAVEIVFGDKILPLMEIEYKVDSRDDFVQGSIERWIYTKLGILKGFTMKLDHFDTQRSAKEGLIEENSYAVFKTNDFRINVPMHMQDRETPREGWGLVEAWRTDMDLYLGDPNGEDARFELTPHIIKLGSVVNDTELPGLKVNYKKKEVSFDWRLMLSKLLIEERLITQRLDQELALGRLGELPAEGEEFSFMDLLEYQRMAITVASCYEGSAHEPCHICAVQGDVERFGPLIRIRGERLAQTPQPILSANADSVLPPHSNGQVLRCPYVWRLYRDIFTQMIVVRHDFPVYVARNHRARREVREQRIRRWYQQPGRTWGIYEDDWVSQARTLQRLRLVRLQRREDMGVAGHEYGKEERVSWYSRPESLPFYRIKGDNAMDEDLMILLGDKTAGPILVYGFYYDYNWEDPRACLIM